MNNDINRLCLACMEYGLDERGVCTLCGADANAPAASPHHLPLRSVLGGKYLAARVLGEGGFGITYLGWDINLEVKVAIKEFYPLGAVTRDSTITDNVSVLTGNMEEFFNKGRDRFVEEARSLAKFHNLPGIVSVRDFFLENGTAYIVMEFVEGVTLKEHLERSGGRMAEAQVLELFRPLVHSLAAVHRAGIIHRDISPDNLMLTPEGTLRLLDFGAARDFNDDNKSLSVLLKPGYAPEEQYRSRGKQGPWTDVYALCATMYRALEGEKPPEAMERAIEDPFRGFTVRVSPKTRDALLKGLAVRGQNRWQSMDELYAALYGVEATVPSAGGAAVVSAGEKPQGAREKAAPPLPRPQKPAGDAAAQKAKPLPKKALPVIIVAGLVVVALVAALLFSVGGGGSGAGGSAEAAAPALAQGAAGWSGPDGPIVIGSVLQLSDLAIGRRYDMGIQLAVEEINAAGGIHGREIEYVSYDEKNFTGTTAVRSAYNHLEKEHAPAVVLGGDIAHNSRYFMEVAAEDGSTPCLVMEDPERYPEAEAANVFFAGENRWWQGEAMAAYARGVLGADSVAAVYWNEEDAYKRVNNELGRRFCGLAPYLGMSVSAAAELADGDAGQAGELLKSAAESGAQVIAIPHIGMPESFETLDALREVGYTGAVISEEDWPNTVPGEGAAFSLFYCTPYNFRQASVEAFWKRFDKKFPDAAHMQDAMLGYEAAYLAASAINAAGTTDHAAVSEALRGLSWDGLTGEIAFRGTQSAYRSLWVFRKSEAGIHGTGRVEIGGGFVPVRAEELVTGMTPEQVIGDLPQPGLAVAEPEDAPAAQAPASSSAGTPEPGGSGDGVVVKHVFIACESGNAEQEERARAVIEELYAELATARASGATQEEQQALFEQMIAQSNEDTGMTDEGYTMEEGMYIQEYYDTAVALAVGEFSEPLRLENVNFSGYCILMRYA